MRCIYVDMKMNIVPVRTQTNASPTRLQTTFPISEGRFIP